jgi:endonuclease/exonuclease/phosphatase (EEP) superfamily protein YafD
MLFDINDPLALCIIVASVLLTMMSLLSYLARRHWLLDILRHFQQQYLIGFSLLVFASIGLGLIYPFILNTIMLALCLKELITYPRQKILNTRNSERPLKIVQYNKFYRNDGNLSQIESWVKQSDADVIIIQEADEKLSNWAKNFESTYPHSQHDPANHPYGIMILSRYEILAYENFHIPESITRSNGYEFHVKAKGFDDPILIVTMHASNAMPENSWKSRNNILKFVANRVAEKNQDFRNIIVAGDWNITPFSPFYKDFLKVSNLNIAYNGLLPAPTWPNYKGLNFFKILQIPIDHIIFSHNLKATRRNVGDSFGSDHHLIEMDFIKK